MPTCLYYWGLTLTSNILKNNVKYKNKKINNTWLGNMPLLWLYPGQCVCGPLLALCVIAMGMCSVNELHSWLCATNNPRGTLSCACRVKTEWFLECSISMISLNLTVLQGRAGQCELALHSGLRAVRAAPRAGAVYWPPLSTSFPPTEAFCPPTETCELFCE